MRLCIYLIYDLRTNKRRGRLVEVYDDQENLISDSELPKQLLLPRVLPQEWLPSGMRSGLSSPVRSWTDRKLFADGSPEGLLCDGDP